MDILDSPVIGKLTNWKNEPSIELLKGDLTSAKSHQETFIAKIDTWKRAYKAEVPVKRKDRSNIQPKLVRTTAEWRYASLSEPFLSSDKLFEVKPRTFEDVDSARQNELLLNYHFNTHIKKVNFIDMLVRATVDEGTSIVKLGWKRKTKKVTKPVYEYTYFAVNDEESVAKIDYLVNLKSSNPREYRESTDENTKESVEYFLETGEYVTAQGTVVGTKDVDEVLENYPTVSILNPRNVYIDPTGSGSSTIDDAMFIIVSEEVSKADLIKDVTEYVNLDKVDWMNSGTLSDAEHMTSTPVDFAFKDSTRRKVVKYDYWGYYDINDTGELEPILASWIGDTLIYLGASPFSDGKLPFIVTTYLPILREFYGETDAELLTESQAVIGAVSRGMIDLLGKSANSQRGYAKGYLDIGNKRRFESGLDYEFNPSIAATPIVEHKYPEFPNSALTMLQLQHSGAEAITGVKAFSQGMTGNSYGDVAIGIKSAVTAQGKREMAILRRLATCITSLGTKIISMYGDFLSDEEVVRVTNKTFVKINREDLKGQFDLSVDISTAEIEQTKSDKLAFLLQTIGNTMDFAVTQMILTEIATLNKLPHLAEKIRTFQPTPDPVAEKLKELELKKLELELTEIESKINLNMAKAKLTSSEADMRDLNFVQEESGVNHARSLDRAKGQARGNQELEITKAMLHPDGSTDVTKAIGYKSLLDQDKL